MRRKKWIDRVSTSIVKWIGSFNSLIVHTILFTTNFSLYFFGIPFDTILLILTTIVSIEAIYLAIFMQISINQQSELIEEETKSIRAQERKSFLARTFKWW
jgi:uncharacterized membrane protein